MGPTSISGTVDAPRERVFEFICDLTRRPLWTDHFMEDYRLERLEGRGEGAGARFHVGAPGIGWMDSVIAEADPPRKIVERGRGGRSNRIAISTVWELVEEPGGVTRVELTFWSEPGRARGARWWKRRWRKALSRLATAIETGEESAPAVRVGGGNRRLTGIA